MCAVDCSLVRRHACLADDLPALTVHLRGTRARRLDSLGIRAPVALHRVGCPLTRVKSKTLTIDNATSACTVLPRRCDHRHSRAIMTARRPHTEEER